MEEEQKKKAAKVCAKCGDETRNLVQCDQCKKRFCSGSECRYDAYDHDVWVLTFCYDCQPQLAKKHKPHPSRRKSRTIGHIKKTRANISK